MELASKKPWPSYSVPPGLHRAGYDGILAAADGAHIRLQLQADGLLQAIAPQLQIGAPVGHDEAVKAPLPRTRICRISALSVG